MFGPEFSEVWPKVCDERTLRLTDFGMELLKKCDSLERPQSRIAINDFMRKSADFPITFGTNTCRVLSQPVERYPIILKQIASAYPVIHERVLGLYLTFLEHKCRYGNEIEQRIYQDLSLTDFVQRLLTKRCACFTDSNDNYVLLTGERGCEGFEQIGTTAQKCPLILENLQSYDEMKLSAFLSVSSHTEFINDGSRDNVGYIESDKSKIEQEGVIIGLIGARFQRLNVMESQDILITKSQNTRSRGYGESRNPPQSDNGGDGGGDNRNQNYRRIWNDFYETQDVLHERILRSDEQRFFQFHLGHAEQMIFDNLMMKKRYAISIDTLLLEAEARAVKAGRQAYVHIVGIGLGVWLLVPQQEQIFLETFAERIEALLPKLGHIAALHFSWFRFSEWKTLKNGITFRSSTHSDGGIRIFLSSRNPADKLPVDYENCLLVVSYAGDSNSMPGNEFWDKCLCNSNNSSAASSSLITELHNPYINREMVNGKNLHIATFNHGVLHIRDYCQNILKLF